jgi:hypothetical protein
VPRKRRKLDRSVTCRISLVVGGKTVKTVKRKLSMLQAMREAGPDPLSVEGRLNSGGNILLSKRVSPAIRVLLSYSANTRMMPVMHTFTFNTQDAVVVAQGNMVL